VKNAIIFHGGGNDSSGNWFPWLKKELEKHGYKVWVPDFPDSEYPDQKKWTSVIFNKKWQFTDETVLVGHSAGATMILRILEQLPEGIKIHKAILVSGPANLGSKPEFYHYKEGYLKDPFDWQKIKRSSGKFAYFYSDNDPYDCGVDQGKIFQEHLGGDMMLMRGEGHFNLEKGPQYNKFPEILEKILE